LHLADARTVLFATWRLIDSEHDADRVQLLGTARALSAGIDLKLQKALAALSALARRRRWLRAI